MSMQNLSYLMIIFLFISCTGTQQTGPSKDPKVQTTGIILKVNQSSDQAFSELINFLKDSGFKMKKVDHFQHYLLTDFKTMDEEMYTFNIEAVIPPADSTIVVFRGEAIGPRVQSSARIRREMGHLSNNLWDRFQDAVIGFPHEEVYYTSD